MHTTLHRAAATRAAAAEEQSSVPASPAELPPPTSIALTIGGLPCTLHCVDEVLPLHSAPRHGARPRLRYAPGEVTHFELAGHRWCLVAEEPAGEALETQGLHERLTNRELQIVQLICTGCLTKQVADRLHISEFTVRSYLKTIYAKLGVRSRGAMVYRYAQALGMPKAEA